VTVTVRAVFAAAAAAAAALAAGCGSGRNAGGPATSAARSTTAKSVAAGVTSTSTMTTRSAPARTNANRTHHHHSDGYGRLPSWLPSAKPPSQKPLHASFSHPKLTLQGEGVEISFGGAHLLATAVGPAVPEIGRTPVPATSPVTFVVTFSHVTAPVALHRSSFVLVDDQHQLHRPRMTALHGGAPPARLRPGPPVSIKLHSVLPTGDGGLEWRPTGGRAIAGWDFNVEID
jgi:hypothetical protein